MLNAPANKSGNITVQQRGFICQARLRVPRMLFFGGNLLETEFVFVGIAEGELLGGRSRPVPAFFAADCGHVVP
jgi:hypothetical protein